MSTDWGHPGFALVNIVEAFDVDPTGTADAGAQINAAHTKMLGGSTPSGSSGQVPWIQQGTFLLTSAVAYRLGLRPIISPLATFMGANAASIYAVPKIQFLGDSNTAGLAQGVYRDSAARKLRQWRSDFEILGSLSAPPTTPPSGCPTAIAPQSWYYDGHSGYTIAQLASGYASYIAAPTGAPDVVVVMAGTNDLSSRTLVQMQGDWANLYAAIIAANPFASVVVMPPPNVVAGSVSGANVAAWQALRNSFRAWLLGTWVPATPGAFFCDASSAPGIGDFYTDGIHWNGQGAAQVGETLAAFLNGLMGPPVVGTKDSGDSLPRTFLPRTAQASLPLWKNSFGASVAAHTGLNAGSGSFTFALDFYPLSTSNAAQQTIATYGTIAGGGGPNWWALLQFGAELRLYWFSAGEVIAASVPNILLGTNVLTANAWHRIVVMADATTSTVGLYVNGACIGLATGVTAWSTAQETFYLGHESVLNDGAIGNYARVMAWQAVPARPGGEQALVAVERDYYLGQSIVAGSCSANFQLDQLLTDQDYSNGPLVAGAWGGGFLTPGWPPRPWEITPFANLPAYPTWISGRVMDLDSRYGLTLTDASLVAAIADQSGYGNDAGSSHQPTLAYQGIRGLPSILFDGASTYMQAPALRVASQPFTIYVVAQVGTQGVQSLVSWTGGGAGLWTMGCQAATDVWIYAGSQDIIKADTLAGAAIFSGVFNLASSSVRTSPGNVAGSGTVGAAGIDDGLGIGADVGGPQWYWDKWISRIIVYNRALSAFEDAAVLACLGQTYGIAVP